MNLSKRWGAVLFLAYCGLLLVWIAAGDFRVFDPRIRYCVVIREMLQSGNWVVPHMNAATFYAHKPPLLFWLGAATAKLFFHGEATVFAARFPSFLLGILTLVLVFWLGKKMFSRGAGWAAMAVLATTVLFVKLATESRFDTGLCFFITAALACFWKMFSDEGGVSRGQACFFWSVFYLSLAGAFFSKGTVGVLFPCGIIFFFLLWERRLRFLLRMWIPLGIVILGVVVGGWIWAATLSAGKEFLYERFVVHEFTRFLIRDSGNNPAWLYNPKPRPYAFHYYFLYFPQEFLPWACFLPFVIWQFFKKRPEGGGGSVLRFLAVWFGLIFIFFTLSSGKSYRYLLPLFPPAALLFGNFFAELWKNVWVRRGFWVTLSGALCGLIFIVGVLIPQKNKESSYKLHASFFSEIKRRMSPEGKLALFKRDTGPFLYFLPGVFCLYPEFMTTEEVGAFLKESSQNRVVVAAGNLGEIREKIPVKIIFKYDWGTSRGNDDFYLVSRAE